MNSTTSLSTRTGRIARLPWKTRQQLNRRLEDGESAQEPVAWLNDSGTRRSAARNRRKPRVIAPNRA